MSHKHVGPLDYACTGCIGVAAKRERLKTIAGYALLIVLVVAAMALLSWYLGNHGTNVR